MEGLAWGPVLPDGRDLLWVCVDNDFKPKAPNLFYAFAVRGRSRDIPLAPVRAKILSFFLRKKRKETDLLGLS